MRVRYRLAALFAVGLAIAVLVPGFVARLYTVPSQSMEQTLHGCPDCDNDRILVDRLVYQVRRPAPGEIVLFSVPDSWATREGPRPGPTNAVLAAVREVGSVLGFGSVDEVDFVKRVIAVGGQTVSCCDERNRVLVDGKPVDEPYIYFAPQAGPAAQKPFSPVRVPDGELWVMGDNRNNSTDSSAPGNGPVPLANLLGKARMVVLPLNRFSGLDDTDPQTATETPR